MQGVDQCLVEYFCVESVVVFLLIRPFFFRKKGDQSYWALC